MSLFTTELPNRNLLGVENAGLVTESRSIPAGQGLLAAGTLLQADGTKSTSEDEPYCVLAFDVDTGANGTTGTIPLTVYLAGSFLRSTVQAASGFTLTPEIEAALRAKGIFLERSVG
jgi:hypothetical protein